MNKRKQLYVSAKVLLRLWGTLVLIGTILLAIGRLTSNQVLIQIGAIIVGIWAITLFVWFVFRPI